MEVRISFRSSPRLAVLVAIMVAFVAIAIIAFFTLGPLAGLLFAVIAVFLDVQIYRFLKGQLDSYVRSDDEGVSCKTSLGDKIRFEWDELSHAGTFQDSKGRWGLFFYNEDDDKLVTVPQDFAGLSALVAEVGAHRPMLDLNLSGSSGVRDELRKLIVPQDEADGHPDDADDNDDESDPPD